METGDVENDSAQGNNSAQASPVNPAAPSPVPLRQAAQVSIAAFAIIVCILAISLVLACMAVH